MGNFVFWALCKFVVEECYCNSFSPAVVPCIGCLVVPVVHTWGNLVVAEGGTVGVAAAKTAEVAAIEIVGAAGPGMPPAGTTVDTGFGRRCWSLFLLV